ncbi:gas vesicle protein [Pseudomonas viridiflava]|uniref:Gas vesicle protein n=1 Tax=Pseudomonas viridiflava TaxID=33069 RepID=A0A3M5PC70_PSEVI|nr:MULTISPECIES: gas vesicle accessory protein GvpU [Pseudomonas syringae group]MBA1229184.1 gas vesicle protein [Pseudomonas viridiflava]MCF5709155.1 gas vesicle protein [Pseudomonas syringae]RMT81653.1 Gas vesicle protein [Pseudomonas viridiflava]
MSDVDQTQQSQPSPNESHDDVIAHIQWQGKQIDWLLQWLVKFVANTKVEMGVTLSVGGNLVSGHLISHDTYFEQLAEDISAPFTQFSNGTDEAMKEMILSFKPGDSAQDTPAFHFIHLKDCRTYSNDGSPICEAGVLWRGRIAAVDGFTIGLIAKK